MPRAQVFSVRDRATATYGRPFYAVSIGQAIRSFSDIINSKEDSEIPRHPADFDLYHLADFDDETGVFECLPQPKMIGVGKDLKLKD